MTARTTRVGVIARDFDGRARALERAGLEPWKAGGFGWRHAIDCCDHIFVAADARTDFVLKRVIPHAQAEGVPVWEEGTDRTLQQFIDTLTKEPTR